ncbi:MAG TPA: TetR/AcrR family transcriptional regulator [Solirubrobacteraceae bacterium]|jgi:AcrR family transcriptional regulator|nr:TetR/AcrR family transcriptional regulator [Solirubrobacteraceae bacterium]
MTSRALVRTRARATRARSASARRGDDSHEQVAEMQRSRLLAATVRTVEELGYAHATVATITRRARVSRRTFYDLFANREDCVAAVLDDAARRVCAEMERAGLEGLPWRERVRGGLWTILSFLDREPVLARVCVVQVLRGSQGVLERREEILRELAGVLDEGRSGESARSSGCPPLTAEGLVGAAFSIVYARLLRGEREPLTDLHPELMGMIVLPYLGPAAARREQARTAPAPIMGHTENRNASTDARWVAQAEHDPLEGIPMRLTYRTARVLEAIAQRPGVSNRLAGDLAGISDQGQISKLLARLERLGLTENSGLGHARGERNEWCLTEKGLQVTQTLRAHAGQQQEVAS